MTPKLIWLVGITLLSAAPEAQAFQCKKKVDPKRVIIMLDTNAGAEEVAAAERSACARGETLRVLPEISKVLAPLAAQQVALQRKSMKCKDRWGDPECVALQTEYFKRQEEIDKLKAAAETRLQIPLEQELERLQTSGAKLAGLIMSGHDGGGRIWGVSGSITRYHFPDLQKKYSGVFGNVQSLYLLGCYTAVPAELKEWKEIFPNLKLVAGYEGRAPLVDMKAGHYYLEDMLKRELPIIHAANEKKLDGELKTKVRGIANVNAAVFVNLGPPCKQCENPEPRDYYYRSQRKLGPKLVRMSERECQAARAEMPPFADDLNKFGSGEKPIPSDTSRGRLREIYEFFRRSEHCFIGEGSVIKADKILFLLFFEDVKKNFATYYAKDLQEAHAVTARMAEPEEIAKRQDDIIQALQADFDWWKKLLDRNSTDPQGAKVSLEEERQRLQLEMDARKDEFFKYASLEPASRVKLGDAAWTRFQETRQIDRKLSLVKYGLRNSIGGGFQLADDSLKSAIAKKTSKLENLAKYRDKFAVLKNIAGASRGEINALLSALNAVSYGENTPPKEQVVIDTVRVAIDEKLADLSCLPFSWHEASPRPERPVCHE